MRTVPLVIAMSLLAGSAGAQGLPPHAYLPRDHWAAAFVEYLVARGAVHDVTPMVRPWTVATVARMLGVADTIPLTGAERTTLTRVRAYIGDPVERTTVTWEAEVALRAATHARRAAFSLRPSGPGNVIPEGGPTLAMQFGRGIILMHPEWSRNLDADPDFGGVDRPVKVRFRESYVGYRSRYLEVNVGAVSRNWGPNGSPGLLVSDWPLSYEHIFVALGPERVRLQLVLAQLDNAVDRRTNVSQRRFFMAHRLTGTPWPWLTLAVWEGQIIAGPNRSLELWYLNPFRIHFQTRNEYRTVSNVWVGGDGELRLGTVRLSGSLTIDDIQLFSTPARDDEPPSFAFTATASVPAGPVNLWAGYTVVSNLMYRTPNTAEVPLVAINPTRGRVGTGLARSFSDYDQVTVRVSTLPLPGVLLTPEVTLLRQGEGDLRQFFPDPSEYPTTATLFQGVVERVWRAALTATVHPVRGITLDLNAGVHRIGNAGHVTGATDTDFVAAVTLRYALGGRWPL